MLRTGPEIEAEVGRKGMVESGRELIGMKVGSDGLVGRWVCDGAIDESGCGPRMLPWVNHCEGWIEGPDSLHCLNGKDDSSKTT